MLSISVSAHLSPRHRHRHITWAFCDKCTLYLFAAQEMSATGSKYMYEQLKITKYKTCTNIFIK